MDSVHPEVAAIAAVPPEDIAEDATASSSSAQGQDLKSRALRNLACVDSNGQSLKKENKSNTPDPRMTIVAKRQHQENLSLVRQELQAPKLDLALQGEKKIQSNIKEKVLRSLHPCQRQALAHVQEATRKQHQAALPTLVLRIQELGFAPDDLDECLQYIRTEAPIVLHMTEKTLSFLVQDTHYRNRFELPPSVSSEYMENRKSWERKHFGTAYDDSDAFHRPKYGCLNFTGDIAGVRGASEDYGAFFLTLAQEIRYRATFADKDTSRSDCSIATNDYYAQTLLNYSDDELRAILGLSRIGGGPSRCIKNYKEVQIHGPVCLATDIQALSVPGREETASKDLRKMVRKFQTMTGCNVLWQDDLLGLELEDEGKKREEGCSEEGE